MKRLIFILVVFICSISCSRLSADLSFDDWVVPNIELSIAGVQTGGAHHSNIHLPPFNGKEVLIYQGYIQGGFTWETYVACPPYDWWHIRIIYENCIPDYNELQCPWDYVCDCRWKVIVGAYNSWLSEWTTSFFHSRKISCVGIDIADNLASNGSNFVGKAGASCYMNFDDDEGCLFEALPFEDCIYMNGHFGVQVLRAFDFDGDHRVSSLDFVMLASRFGKEITDPIERLRFDVDRNMSKEPQDGNPPVSMGDIAMFCENWLVLYEPQTYGDYNLDWKVNLKDFAILAESWASDSNSYNELKLFTENYPYCP